MSSKVLAGRYELIGKIGDGGMAVVYKAKDRLLNRNVAIKILKPEFTDDEKFVENFRRESHAAARLQNPNIVNVFDVGKEGNINYIVMELVEGETLADVIKREAPMDSRQVATIARQIANGLASAHKNGIVHKDIKPHNILMNEDGVAKITDFGIAKAVTNTTIVDNTNGAIMGSVHYFSPEQARGGFIDEKSDIYSLGIVMYEMLTGRVPFDGENPVQIALMHINDQMVPPSQYVKNIPPNLERVVLKATQKFQSKRFANANEMIRALDEAMMVHRVVGPASVLPDDDEEYMAPPKKMKHRKNGKKKAIIIVACLVCLVLAGVGIAYVTGMIGPKVETPDFRGMTLEQAQEKAESVGLNVEKGDDVFSTSYDNGEIVSQDPDKGEKVRKGTTVRVNICRGDGTVPRVVGMSKSEAEKTITSHGFKLGEVTKKTDVAPADEVIAQDPEAGDEAEPGSAINITISDGEGMKTVPNLLGKTESEAKKAIRDAGLSVGSVTEEYNDEYEEGEVCSQSEKAGSQVAQDTSIDIVISKGKSQEEQSINLTIDFADAEEDVFYLTVTLSDESGTRNIISRSQRSKSDGQETITLKGKGKGTVTVIFDDKTVMKRKVDFDTGEMS